MLNVTWRVTDDIPTKCTCCVPCHRRMTSIYPRLPCIASLCLYPFQLIIYQLRCDLVKWIHVWFVVKHPCSIHRLFYIVCQDVSPCCVKLLQHHWRRARRCVGWFCLCATLLKQPEHCAARREAIEIYLVVVWSVNTAPSFSAKRRTISMEKIRK